MKIREAVTDDLPEMIELWKEFMDFHKVRDPFFTRSENGHEKWAKFALSNMESDDWIVLVAVDGDKIVGYCMASVVDYPPVLEIKQHGLIQDITVTKSSRRKGVGTQLYREAERWLLEKGVIRIELNVAATNEISRAFFRYIGFKDYVQRLAQDY